METIFESNETLAIEILEGLSVKQKYLPSKLFYDEYGSHLFDQICDLDEYYLTRTELSILNNNIDEIVNVFRPNTLLIEFGSGSSIKTKSLLDKLNSLSGYIPIDISEEYLYKSAERLKESYPNLAVYPLAADYTKPIDIPKIKDKVERKITFFPGSTIGNFTKNEAKDFLKIIAEECGKGGGLIIGFDLVKEREVLLAAYNDAEGITAKFNLNLLRRLNREFYADFDLSAFEHIAVFNEEDSRIEMHLASLKDQSVRVGGEEFTFLQGETILTEYSHKYTLGGFKELAEDYFTFEKYWTDENNYFCIAYLPVKLK